jgi:hypothetical protein
MSKRVFAAGWLISILILGEWSIALPASVVAQGSQGNRQDKKQPPKRLEILWVEPIHLDEPLIFYVAGKKREERDIWFILMRPVDITPFTERGVPPVQLIFNDTPTVYLWAPSINGYLATAAVRSKEEIAESELWAPPYGALAGQLSHEELDKLHLQSRKQGTTLSLSEIVDATRIVKEVRNLKTFAALSEHAREVLAKQGVK